MTATEMYTQFVQEVNLSNNNSIPAVEVERFLNEAVYDYINGILQQTTPAAMSGTGYEDSLWSMNMLSPLKEERDVQPQGDGFVPTPTGWLYWVAIRAQGPNACDTDDDWLDVRIVSENDLGSFRGNHFTKPRYGTDSNVNPVLQNQPMARMLQLNNQGGLQLLPPGPLSKVKVRTVYVRHPRKIEIKTPEMDLEYQGTANFVVRSNDVNCELPDLAHPTIVRIAVNKYDQSVGNIEALSTGVQQLTQGYT